MQTRNPNILITGATGNVGQELISSLIKKGHQEAILAGVRSLEKDTGRLPKDIACVQFDFEVPSSFKLV